MLMNCDMNSLMEVEGWDLALPFAEITEQLQCKEMSLIAIGCTSAVFPFSSLLLLGEDCPPLSVFEDDSFTLCPIIVSKNNTAIISITTVLGSQSSSRALRCNWRGFGEQKGIFFPFPPPVKLPQSWGQ